MSNANGTVHGYVIQGRSITEIPVVLEGGPVPIVLTKERWTTIPTAKVAEFGVPNPIWSTIADEQGLLTYTTAVALMAKLASELRFSGPEFRLLQRKLEYSWSIEDVGTTEPFTFGDRERAEKITPISRPPFQEPKND